MCTNDDGVTIYVYDNMYLAIAYSHRCALVGLTARMDEDRGKGRSSKTLWLMISHDNIYKVLWCLLCIHTVMVSSSVVYYRFIHGVFFFFWQLYIYDINIIRAKAKFFYHYTNIFSNNLCF